MIHLIVGLIKKISLCKMSNFPEPFIHKIKVELNLVNYATKADLKRLQALIPRNLLKMLI